MAETIEIIDITVGQKTVNNSNESFGKPMIVSYHTQFPERTKEYSSASALLADGFAVTSGEYLAAKTMFAQSPSPNKILLGRLNSVIDMQVDFTPIVQSTTRYSILVNDVLATFVSPASATLAQILTGLVSAINALTTTTNVVASDQTTFLRLKHSTAGKKFSANAKETVQFFSDIKQTHTVSAVPFTADLDAILNERKDWFAFTMLTAGPTEITLAAAWAVSKERMLIQQTQDTDILTSYVAPPSVSATTDIGSVLKNAASKGAALIYNQDMYYNLGAGWIARAFALQVQSITFAHKTLNLCRASDLTTVQRAQCDSRGVNYFESYETRTRTFKGTVSKPATYIDSVVSMLWIKSRLILAIDNMFLAKGKVPMTIDGISLVKSVIMGELTLGVQNEVIDSFTLFVPERQNIPAIDVSNRVLQGIVIDVSLQGAIHTIKMSLNELVVS